MKRADMTPEQKAARNRQNAPSRNAYAARTYDRLSIRIRRDGEDGVSVEQVKAAAQRAGMSVNAWILDAIREAL